MTRSLLVTFLALSLGVAIAVGIRRRVEGPRLAVEAIIAAQEASMRLPVAAATVALPADPVTVLVGMEQAVVVARWQEPHGTGPEVHAWWREHRHAMPHTIAMSQGRFLESDLKGMLSSSLYEALLELAEAHKTLGQLSGEVDDEFHGRIIIAVDRRIPWDTLRRVLYTAGQAQFSEFALSTQGGGAVEYGVTALTDRAMVSIGEDRLLVSWFSGAGAVEVPCAWGCEPGLSEVLARMRWHAPHHRGGVILPRSDTPVSRIFAVQRLLSPDSALLAVLGGGDGEDDAGVATVSLTDLLSAGEPLHALMEAHRQTAERLAVGPIRIDSPTPMRWRTLLEGLPEPRLLGLRGAEGGSVEPALGVNDIRACMLPALIAQPERSGTLEVTVRMSGEAIDGVHVPWPEASGCLSRRLVGRPLRPPPQRIFGWMPSADTSRATARITVTIAEAS
jgi:hypothetical protein